MRAVIATYGTTGDVQPLLGLGAELIRRGHTVKFAAPPDFGPRITSLGFDFAPLGPPTNLRELRGIYGQAALTGDAVDFVRRTLPLVIRDTPQMVADLSKACQGTDILISLPYQLAGRILHDLEQIPLAAVFLSPFGSLGRKFAAESSKLINGLRQQYGLEELYDPLGPEGNASILGLHAVSRALIRPPRHWPKCHQITGFFFFDEEWVPEPTIARFISSGKPPVVISFGSMLHEFPEHLAETILCAIERVGKRAVVQRGWTGLQFRSAPSSILTVDFIPHWWLFPRAGCVVHAGGAGTTAATLRAGVPSVIVPHLLDQFVWASLLRERGCASDVIPFAELSAERLATAIDLAFQPSYQKDAATFPDLVGRENGASKAADLIESQAQVSSFPFAYVGSEVKATLPADSVRRST